MINISKQGDSIVFSFDKNDRYLQNGQISVPINSLSLSFDNSGFATFKKAANNDVFLEFFPENSNLATKENIINFYANNMVNIGSGSGSTGGGISDAPIDGKLYGRKDASWTEVPSGVTAGEVDSKIATAVADLATDVDLEAVSGKVDENTAAIGGKQDTLVSGTNIKTVNGETLLGSGDIAIQGGGVGQTYSGSTFGEIFNDYTTNVASGMYSHAEGYGTTAKGQYSHTEGYGTTASGDYSHAEGCQTTASGSYGSHAEGQASMANGDYSHAEGTYTEANGDSSHAEGFNTIAKGQYSHAEGNNTKANNEAEHAQGQYNKSNTGSTEADKTIHSIGIGASYDDRKNAQEVMLNGDYYIYGIGDYNGKNYSEAQTLQEVISALTDASGSTSGGGISDAPSDGKLYGRKNGAWNEVPSGITAEDVDSKIATAVADLATDTDLQAVSGKVDENTAAISGKQDTLVSGTNIKTIGHTSIIGMGNIPLCTINGESLIGIKDFSVGLGAKDLGGEIFNSYTGETKNTATGECAHAEGIATSAPSQAEHAEGMYNQTTFSTSLPQDACIHTVGIGTSEEDRKNAHEIKKNGDTYIYGIGGYNGKNYTEAQTVQEVISALTEASGSTSSGGGVGQTYPESTFGEIFNDYENNKSYGQYSHAEGFGNTAEGNYSHAEGGGNIASGIYSHVEGNQTRANGYYSHSEGNNTNASGSFGSHAEGSYTKAKGDSSHAEGSSTIANNESEHAQGKYNKSNTGSTEADKTIHSIGIGTSTSDRKNAQEVMTNGDYYVLGIGGYDGTNYSNASTLQKVVNGKLNCVVLKENEYSGLGTYDITTLYIISEDNSTITKVYLGNVVLFGA